MLAAGGALALGGTLSTRAYAQKMDDIAINLDWIVRSDHAMFFVAKDKGYFEKNGINVTAIRRGTGSTDTIRAVGNGNADFGFGDLPTLMVGRVQGVPVTAIAAVNQKSPMAMISVKSRKPMTKPSDLKGMNVGVQPSGSTYVFLKSFLAANGMTMDDIKQFTVAPPYESYLVLGRVEAVPGYLNAEVPELEDKTGGPGSLSIIQGADFGYNAYGSGVFTSEKLIAEKPDLVQRFMNAYSLAFKDVVDNPKGAVDTIIKLNPEFETKRDILTKQLDANLTRSFFSDESKANGLGVITPAHWKTTADTLMAQDVLPKTASTTAGYDMKFQAASSPYKR
jgi:NitT/TauT family transport system substrate-binding protein